MTDAAQPPDKAGPVGFLAPEKADRASPQALDELASENIARSIPERTREQAAEK
jgi:hypothetical protein